MPNHKGGHSVGRRHPGAKSSIPKRENYKNGMLERYSDITLAVNIMYINKIPFIMTTSWAIHFGMTELIKNEKVSTIIIDSKQVIKTYHARGFKI